jgi:hypothetical protein
MGIKKPCQDVANSPNRRAVEKSRSLADIRRLTGFIVPLLKEIILETPYNDVLSVS